MTISLPDPYFSHQDQVWLDVIQAIHHSLTLSMSHHKYNEWIGMIEIGIWGLQRSPQPVLESLNMDKFGMIYSHFSHQDQVCL